MSQRTEHKTFNEIHFLFVFKLSFIHRSNFAEFSFLSHFALFFSHSQIRSFAVRRQNAICFVVSDHSKLPKTFIFKPFPSKISFNANQKFGFCVVEIEQSTEKSFAFVFCLFLDRFCGIAKFGAKTEMNRSVLKSVKHSKSIPKF